MIPENDPLSVIAGYFESADSMIPVPDIQDKDIWLAKTAFIVDPEKNYTALVAIRKSPRITLSDVQKTLPKGKSLEIHFTLDGARKWAAMTKENTGKQVALVINGKIYDMPMIHDEINTGAAQIGGLEERKPCSKTFKGDECFHWEIKAF